MENTFLTIVDHLNRISIQENRKRVLEEIANCILIEQEKAGRVNLNFICTHNSRRSQFSQVWSHFLSRFYGFNTIHSYSGGTESTAVYPEVIHSLKRSGFDISSNQGKVNPHYKVSFNEKYPVLTLYSKTFDDPSTPTPFIALMTCSDADQNCPLIPTALHRIPLTYEDPKVSDGSEFQQRQYDERSLQIASELNYLFKIVLKK